MAAISVSATSVDAPHLLAAVELAHACGAGVDWVVQLVEVGIIEVRVPAERPDDWSFQSFDLQCALAARRLERDFGVGLDAAALILDLQHEVRRLKARLAAEGLAA
ncbi:MAG: chaperone modulator CbpM [Gammaproteobacteria bacterium]|nr:chaperone modulator CbpM [Gammaproteobacteria bacterium]MBU1443674.1 chaperone modulator CbpM [Gammaproteobacteria bacterium]MBU2287046.1 chaperone modulator CbpM [Gammaproteobacteria bacterium]MBU2411180.1 chaperone modulator CbpM [Gammaproteobacteria bacterium]